MLLNKRQARFLEQKRLYNRTAELYYNGLYSPYEGFHMSINKKLWENLESILKP